MIRLIENGLMFGGLIEVASPALVERYRRAMKHLTGQETKLADFHIDLSGFSPEIGDELGDPLYLNPDGCNRQFILLTTAQKEAPLLNIRFSTSRGVLRQFIETNEAALFALTARDAVAGELQNSVYDVATPQRLFDIRKVTVEADTIGGHVADAGKLTAMIERFRGEGEAWQDEALIAGMIALARKTGDITRVPVSLPAMSFEQANFWTGLFGGIYLFRDLRAPAAISVAPLATLGSLPIGQAMDLSDRNQIAEWMVRNELVEPIVEARGADAAAILRQKMDFILVDAADTLGIELGEATRTDLRKIAHRLGEALPDEFKGLASMLRWVEGGGDWPRITSEHPSFFYTLRSKPHKDRDLVNMLLAELTPLDVRQMFILHKEKFYAAYAGWSGRKRGYVAKFLATEYAVDKAGARTALFGPEPGMVEPLRSGPEPRPRTMIDRVGPWGALRR